MPAVHPGPNTGPNTGPILGPVTGLIAALVLLGALAGTVGLTVTGWVVGIGCAVTTTIALNRGLAHYHRDRLGPADWVTLTRATLTGAVAALTADSFTRPTPVTTLVTLSILALSLDALDGAVARATGTTSTLGAIFDREVDAFLILVLSIYLAPTAGTWVLTIGAARYAFAAAGWAIPWIRAPLPPLYCRKVVAATQGITLTAAATHTLPHPLTTTALAAALALLTESFGHDLWWLHHHKKHSDTNERGGGRRSGGSPSTSAVPLPARYAMGEPAGGRDRIGSGDAARSRSEARARLVVWRSG